MIFFKYLRKLSGILVISVLILGHEDYNMDWVKAFYAMKFANPEEIWLIKNKNFC
jgi:hypothetical protein